jgi:phage shock protein PspC (stress-responsive transcriptional regulator)
MATRKGLHRSDDRILAGVCGGIADWLDWSPTQVRILYVLVSILSAAFPGILVYLLLWCLMPTSLPKASPENWTPGSPS